MANGFHALDIDILQNALRRAAEEVYEYFKHDVEVKKRSKEEWIEEKIKRWVLNEGL